MAAASRSGRARVLSFEASALASSRPSSPPAAPGGRRRISVAVTSPAALLVPVPRRSPLSELFGAFDINGDGLVSAHEIALVANAARTLGAADSATGDAAISAAAKGRLAAVGALMQALVGSYTGTGLAQGYQLPGDRGRVTITLDGTGCPGLARDAFMALVHCAVCTAAPDGRDAPASGRDQVGASVNLAAGCDDEHFADFVAAAKAAAATGRQVAVGTTSRGVAWDVFQLLDSDRRGWVRVAAVEALLAPGGSGRGGPEAAAVPASVAATPARAAVLERWKSRANRQETSAVADEDITDFGFGDSGPAVSSKVTGSGAAEAAADRPAGALSLEEFQQFLAEFSGGDQTGADDVLAAVSNAAQESQRCYMEAKGVRRVFEAILDDLLRSQPADALVGMIDSVSAMRGAAAAGRLEGHIDERVSRLRSAPRS